MKKILIVGALLAACSAASAQSPIIQSGSVTPGHAWKVITNGVAGDAGTAANGSLTSLGVTASGPALCQNSGPVTGPYNQLCFSPTGTGGGFSWFNYGGATGTPTFNINGTLYPFFGSGTGNVLGPSTTTPGCLAPWANTTGTLLASNCALSISGTLVTLNGGFTSITSPSLSAPFGGASPTPLATLYFDQTATQAATAEISAVFTMNSTVGSGHDLSAFKQALGAQAICGSSSASCWAATFALATTTGFAGTHQQSVEVDSTNGSGTDCTEGDPAVLSAYCGNLVITGSGPNKLNFGILIQGGGEIIDGIILGGDSVGPLTNGIKDYGSETTVLNDVGSHTHLISAQGTYGGAWLYGPSGNFTVTGSNVATTGSISTTNFLYASGNLATTYPSTAPVGLAVSSNFSNGDAETDFWNTFVSAIDSFRWYQMTDTGAATLLMDLNTAGAITLGTNTLELAGNLTTSGAYATTFSMSGAYTYTFPGLTDTLVGIAATQTLTNKTIAFASNTLTGVAPLASPTFTGTLNINGISGAGSASEYVCVDSSGNMLTQSGAC